MSWTCLLWLTMKVYTENLNMGQINSTLSYNYSNTQSMEREEAEKVSRKGRTNSRKDGENYCTNKTNEISGKYSEDISYKAFN